MSISESLSNISDKLTEINTFRQEMIDCLVEKDANISAGSLLDIAKEIYKFGNNSEITPFDTFSQDLPSGIGNDALKAKFQQLHVMRGAIYAALQSRGLDLPSYVSFTDLKMYLEMLESTDQVIDVLSVENRNGDTVNTTYLEIVDRKEEYEYKYFIGNNPSFTDLSLYSSEFGNIEISDRKSIITVVEIDTDENISSFCCIYPKIVEIVKPDILKVVSLPSENSIHSTIINIQDKVKEDRKFVYCDYNSSFDSLNKYDILTSQYSILNTTNEEIQVSINNKLAVFEVDQLNRVYKYKSISLNFAKEAEELIVTYRVDSNSISFNVNTESGYLYYYGIDVNITNILDKTISTKDLTPITSSQFTLNNVNEDSILTIVALDESNKLEQYIDITIDPSKRKLGKVTATSTATGQYDQTSIIHITSAKKSAENMFYYKKMEGNEESSIKYGDLIDNSYQAIIEYSGVVTFKNNTRLLLVEATPDDKIVSVGSVYVTSNDGKLQLLVIESSAGRYSGYTFITVYDNELSEDRKYVYYVGNKLCGYNEDATTGWKEWNGTDDIYVGGDNVPVTIAEVNEQYKIKKVGIAISKVRPTSLTPLTVISRTGYEAGCTRISVSPAKYSLNHYKYQFRVELPELMEDASEWLSWDGLSEIEVVGYSSICIVECDNNNHILSAGLADVHIKDIIPVVGRLTISTSAGEERYHTIVTVEPELREGYHYAYKFTEDIPEYHYVCDDTWTMWDGISEIEAEHMDTICIVEVTTDNAVDKAGTATCISNY